MKVVDSIKKLLGNLRKKSKYLYRSGWNSPNNMMATSAVAYTDLSSTREAWVDTSVNSKKIEDTRIEKKPIEVFRELISETPKVDMANIDAHIKLVKKRLDFMKDHMGIMTPADELEALGFLEARKKYIKHQGSFNWQVTNKEKVDELCKKYKVMLVNFASYYRNVPMEALDELEAFIKAYGRINQSFF